MSRSERMPTSRSPSLRTGRCRISCSFSRSIAFFIESPSSTNTGFLFIRLATFIVVPPWRIRFCSGSGEQPTDQVKRLRHVDLRNDDAGSTLPLPQDERPAVPLPRDERPLGERRDGGSPEEPIPGGHHEKIPLSRVEEPQRN